MANTPFEHRKGTTIRDLYPHLNEEQLREAENNLERYLALVLRIYERIRNDPQSYAVFKALTAARRSHYDKGEKVEP